MTQRNDTATLEITNRRMIHITDPDLKRLRQLIASWRGSDFSRRNDLEELEEELDRGSLVRSDAIPRDVITINSTAFLLDIDTGERFTHTLVFPNDADLHQNKISVLSPIGTAMLGCCIGDTFELELPDTIRYLKVMGILHQPEASGHYDL